MCGRWAAESLRAETDDALLKRAEGERRVLITSDRDFGELVFYRRLVSTGIILLRLDRLSITARLELLGRKWQTIADLAAGRFVVVSPGSDSIAGFDSARVTMAELRFAAAA